METVTSGEFAVQMVDIHKNFGPIHANKGVSLNIKKGEILSIIGESGSGKTTLMNMLFGIYCPDRGRIFVDGKPVRIRSPKEAQDLKIGMINQEFNLVDAFTAAENVKLGFKITLRSTKTAIKNICECYNIDLDMDKKVDEMSVYEKQAIEIVKALYRGADILILDEPTAALTKQETEALFNSIRNIKEDGKSVVIITRKLKEIADVSDRVAVLRKGECTEEVEPANANMQSVYELMPEHADSIL